MLRLLAFLAALLAAAFIAEWVAEAIDRHRAPPRGIFADAGGHKLRLVTSGATHEGPTVLLDSGIGGATAENWAWVQRGVASFAPVVSYDRARLRASGPAPGLPHGEAVLRRPH